MTERKRRATGGKVAARKPSANVPIARQAVLEDARRARLLRGNKSAHVSFRAPPALVAAAKRQTGIDSTSELGLLALAMLAEPDPFAAFMKRNYGRLGKDHMLDY